MTAWTFNSDLEGWEMANWPYEYNGAFDAAYDEDTQSAKVSVDFSADADKGYSKAGGISIWNDDKFDFSSLGEISFDIIVDNIDYTGDLSINIYTKNEAGDDFQLDPVIDKAAFTEVNGKYVQHVTVKAGEPSIAEAVQIAFLVVGKGTDYVGDIHFDNIALVNASQTTVETRKTWTFDNNDMQGWENVGSYGYGDKEFELSAEDEMLKFDVDYTDQVGNTWSEVKTQVWDNDGIDFNDVTKIKLDFFFNPDNRTTGSFKMKAWSDVGINDDVTVDEANAVTLENGLVKASVTIPVSPAGVSNKLILSVIGNETDYQGAIYLDNIELIAETVEDPYVDATVMATGGATKLSIQDGKLVTGVDTVTLPTTVNLVTENASANAKATYAFLKAMGESKAVMYGHQNDTWKKAGSSALSESDTKDLTGSISGVIGMDTLSLTGNEYDALQHNDKFGTNYVDCTSGNVAAAADLTNKNIEQGAIITLSAHLPNFKLVADKGVKEVPAGGKSYDKYDFYGYTPGNFDGDVMNNILPGGAYNAEFTAYLDMIADFADQVDGTVLFRPFHENTGSWFWWGAAFCSPETYKSVYRYTVDYLKEAGVDNFIYVYSPGAESTSVAEFEERYPGNDYVDMVGFDMYNDSPSENDGFIAGFKNQIDIVQTFARENNKLFAISETGMRASVPDKGHNQTALHLQGNEVKDWHARTLEAVSDSDASFYLVWANFGKKDGYYSPFVESVKEDGTLHGHEMMDNFIEFFNDDRSVFAENQQAAINSIDGDEIVNESAATEARGYITAPIGGTRILEETKIEAKVYNTQENVTFNLTLGNTNISVPTVKGENNTYTAVITEEVLGQIGEGSGFIRLMSGNTELQAMNVIYNVEPPVIDPLVVDNFETYLGADAMLNNAWTPNRGTDCKLSLKLDSENKYDGDYSMSFTYDETSTGYAGATINKEVDWSSRNAMQFWTKPDGNNQKVVIQITANGNVYEAYLNDYAEYCDTTDAMLVTIPFAEFVARDITGNPKGGLVEDSVAIQSIGLFVNAIGSSEAVVDGRVSGTIYYDKLTATEVEDTKTVVFNKNYSDLTPTPSPTPSQKPSYPSDDDDDNTSSSGSGSSSNGSSNTEDKKDENVEDTKNEPIVVKAPENVEATIKEIDKKDAEKFSKFINETNGLTLAIESINKIDFSKGGKEYKLSTPVPVIMSIKGFDAKDTNKLTVVEIIEENNNIQVVPVGGSYNKADETVTAYISNSGTYAVIEKDDLVQIELQIGSEATLLNKMAQPIDVAPIIKEDKTMVPLRYIAETMNAEVKFNHLTKTVTIEKGNKKFSLKADTISNGRTLVPLRYIAENLDCNVIWIADSKDIIIVK